MQVKGRRHPVSVYHAFAPVTAEPLSEKPQRRVRILEEDFADPAGITHHDHSMQGLPSNVQTPLIGADIMLTQVPGQRLSLMST